MILRKKSKLTGYELKDDLERKIFLLRTDEHLSHNSYSNILWEAQISFQSRACLFWCILLPLNLLDLVEQSGTKWGARLNAFIIGTQRTLNDYVKKWATYKLINPG